jgi:general secretion pathway protein K
MSVKVAAGSRGVALLSALVIVAIATAVAAAITFDTGLSLGRAQAATAAEEATQLVTVTETLAADFLEQEVVGLTPIHPAQAWAQPVGPLLVGADAALEGVLEDMTGRFNVNALVNRDGTTEPAAVAVLARLLRQLELDPRWAEELADWIDTDTRTQEGASEDLRYSSGVSPYRAANQILVSTAELFFLQGYTAEHHARLAPHIVALPRDAGLNVCAASAELLDALTDERQWTEAREALMRNRSDACFPRLDALRNSLGDPQTYAELQRSLGLTEESRYFRLYSLLSVGSSQFSLYSLLRIDPDPAASRRIQLMQRSRSP